MITPTESNQLIVGLMFLPSALREEVISALAQYPEMLDGVQRRFIAKCSALQAGDMVAIAHIVREEENAVQEFCDTLLRGDGEAAET